MSHMDERPQHPSNKIITIPNVMSLFRILLIPLIVWLYCVKREYKWTVAVLLLSAATDIVDGWIARRFNMVSNVGKILDPVADKLTQGITLLCLVSEFPLLVILFLVLIAKETVMVVTGVLAIKKTGLVCGADWHGKATTCLLYLTMMTHIFWHDIPPALSTGMMVSCIAVMLLSLTLYTIRNLNQMRSAKAPLPNPEKLA